MPVPNEEFDRVAVVTIQGGGVYGLGLLGQLSALIDRHQIIPIALAGTSAGAIIAALYWAGLTPKEIRDRFLELAVIEQKDRQSKMAHPSQTSSKEILTDLLGPFGANRNSFNFGSFRKLADRIESLFGMISQLEEVNLELQQRSSGSSVKAWDMALGLAKKGRISMKMVGCMSRLAFQAFKITPQLSQRGFFSGDKLESVIDTWIRRSPKLNAFGEISEKQGLITFGDVRQLIKKYPDNALAYFPPLILTATNLSTGRLDLIHSFDDRFSNIPIARAVRASAGFPVFFKPVLMQSSSESGWYVDGGVVANFPAWVFSSDLRRRMSSIHEFADLTRRPWLNIGLRSVDSPREVPRDPSSFREFAKSLFGLMTGQVRNELERALTSRMPRSIRIEQPDSESSGPRNLLDVDQLTDDKIRLMFHRGDEFADRELANLSFDLPRGKKQKAIEESLADLASRASKVLDSTAIGNSLFRCNVFVPKRNTLKLQYSYNMRGSKDQDISFTYNAGLTGLCYTTHECWTCNLEMLRTAVERHPDQIWFGMPAEQHRQVASDRTWLASVPIFDPHDNWPRTPKRPKTPKDLSGIYLAHSWECDTDGAILGILNLDSSFSYEQFKVSQDMFSALTDRRIQTIIALLVSTSREIGMILADAFAHRVDNVS